MIRSTITTAGNLIRANVFSVHGASTQTCRTVSEARAFIAMAANRSPVQRNARQATTQPTKKNVIQLVRNET